MRRRILIVDDDKNFLDSTADMLQPGIEPVKAGPENAAARALDIWRREDDLLIALVDLYMPESGRKKADRKVGINLIREMKRIRPEAIIAVNSGVENHDALAEAVRVGSDAFIGKDWKRDKVLDNIQCLWGLITAGSALQALSTAIDAQGGDAVRKSQRVTQWCRMLIIHLESANAKNFDLASCLCAAALHELGGASVGAEDPIWGHDIEEREQRRDELERQKSFVERLKPLGREFHAVTDILVARRRCFDTPKAPFLVDFPDGDEPRKDRIPFEARVLSVAAAMDALTACWPQGREYDVQRAQELIKSETSLGKFDPRVVDALDKALKMESESVAKIVESSRSAGNVELKLFFLGDRITIDRIKRILNLVEGISTEGSRGIAILSISREDDGYLFTICGAAERMMQLQKRLERRQKDRDLYDQQAGQRTIHSPSSNLLESEFGSVPERIEISHG